MRVEQQEGCIGVEEQGDCMRFAGQEGCKRVEEQEN